ncbi:hypothetical protein KEM56_000667 [Ascosphaera pollenicola]|nr:hypothetical protein KEM56_000667 [Ascosphaera pollenicola]
MASSATLNTLRRRGLRFASTQTGKASGNISSIFPSLQPGYKPKPLAPRFAELKKNVFDRNSDALIRGYGRLVESLEHEVQQLRVKGAEAFPSINYSDFVSGNISKETLAEIHMRGSVVIRGVIPKSEALDLKQEAREYIAANQEKVKAFPADSPASKLDLIPGCYNCKPSFKKLWHSSDPDTNISMNYATTYADRFRIRVPGDGKFALGPHADGGSLERWEDAEYSRVYTKILEGDWEAYDAWDAKHRVAANMDHYNGAGACSMLRFFQGWLSMSDTGPGEGTLHVCPIVNHSIAYTMLRPFFNPQTGRPDLEATFPGSVPGMAQEYNPTTHPHLYLEATMVSVPHVEPGDYVAWHCDTIHSVDKEHRGKGDSSVMYIPVTPLGNMNAGYLKRQREAALAYSPPPDFPGAGGPGEAGFNGATSWNAVSKNGLQAMGMGSETWKIQEGMSEGERRAITEANKLLFP